MAKYAFSQAPNNFKNRLAGSGGDCRTGIESVKSIIRKSWRFQATLTLGEKLAPMRWSMVALGKPELHSVANIMLCSSATILRFYLQKVPPFICNHSTTHPPTLKLAFAESTERISLKLAYKNIPLGVHLNRRKYTLFFCSSIFLCHQNSP